MLQPTLTNSDLTLIGFVLMCSVVGFGTLCWGLVALACAIWDDWHP